MAQILDNYLRTYRKRSGLSQKETALLLDCDDGTKIYRYERGIRQPGLETALALRRVFGAPIEDLFPGVIEKVDKKVVKRAQLLAQKIQKNAPTPLNTRKLARLAAIASGPTTENQPATSIQ